MAVEQNLEILLQKQIDKINELEIATTLIKNKTELKDSLLNIISDIDAMNRGLSNVRGNLEYVKLQNEKCRKSINFLHLLEEKIEYLENNIPADLIYVLNETGNDIINTHSESNQEKNLIQSSKKINLYNDDIIDPNEYLPKLTDCRKTLFPDTEDNQYTIEFLNDIEFAKVPKYMIGRQTLSTLNDFISTINKIMKAKYNILDLGKNGAKKKGVLDLYLKFKKEETDVCSGKERKYFFTSEDYQREMQCKLDKMKLNLLTVLRHCRRIQELRSGKSVKYEVITTVR